MKRKELLHHLIILFVFFVLSCNQQKDKIGLLIASPVFEPNLKYFTEKLNQKGYEVLSANANYDDKLQISQAKEIIEKGVKVLVIIPVNTFTSAEIVRYAEGNKVKTIALERIISNCNLDYFVSFDNVKIGETLAREALKIKPKGNYFILNGDISDQNAVWVREGFYNVMKSSINSGDVKVVYDVYIEDWLTEDARHEFEKYINLTGNIPDAVLSAYNGMNDGIFEFLSSENILEIPLITGQDIDTKKTRALKNQNQKITLYKSPEIETNTAAELAINIIEETPIEIDMKVYNGAKDVNCVLIQEMSLEKE